MNEVATRHNPDTGEVLPDTFREPTGSLAVQLAQVELNQAVTTAHAFPRSMQLVRNRITDLVMLDEDTAAECVYALPRGGKPIKGPSIRFAEIIASQYGNCHVGSRVIEVNKFEKYVEAEGVFHDLETGMKRTARTRRRIVDSKGRLYNDDMILVTSNAACSIALREAILKGVPKALWRKAYDAAETVIAGDVKTLAVRRGDAMKAFAAFGVKPEQIFASLEVDGMDDISTDHIGTLTAMFLAIKNGEQQVEDYFPAKTDAKAGVDAAKGTAGKLADIAKGGKGKAEAAKDNAKSQTEAEDGKAKPGDDATADQTAEDRQHGKADDEGQTAQHGDQGGTADQTDDDRDAHDAAYQRGRKAHGRGMKADAVPTDLKDEALRTAWVEGWKDARDEAEGGE